jgi:hypothetical protein
MVYSYQVIKFNSISLVSSSQWSQSIVDVGVRYKAIKDPYSKLIIQSTSGTKKLFRVPKDRTVLVLDNVAHFLGEIG